MSAFLGYIRGAWEWLANALFRAALPLVREAAKMVPSRSEEELVAFLGRHRLISEFPVLRLGSLGWRERGILLKKALVAVLGRRYPGVPVAEIDAAVQKAYEFFKGAR